MDEVGLLKHYETARAYVEQPVYSAELQELRSFTPDSLTRDGFLAEYTHVVLVSGFSNKVLQRRHPRLEQAFKGYDCDAIAESPYEVRSAALRAFNNERKIDGIIRTATLLAESDWEEFKANATGASHSDFLTRLPFIGPVTVHHLAINIGLDDVKDDRHLDRLAKEFGYGSGRTAVVAMAKTIQKAIGEQLRVIDRILWRYEEQGRPRS